MVLDDTDLRILKTLSDEGNPSSKHIEDGTGIPKSTVHYRLEQLKEAGVITNDLYELDADALGLGVRIITHVTAEYEEDYHESVGSQLREIEGVTDVYFTLGDTDFVVIAHLADSNRVEELVREYEAIDGVVRTSSTLVISTVKEDSNPLRSYSLETLRDLDLAASE